LRRGCRQKKTSQDAKESRVNKGHLSSLSTELKGEAEWLEDWHDCAQERGSHRNQQQLGGSIKDISLLMPFSLREVFCSVISTLVVKSILKGYNGTVFTYRQTGSGKMHTMEGATSEMSLRRVIPNAFEHIFDHIALNGSNDKIPCADIML